MADPIYTYAAVGFIVGVLVGLGLSGELLRRAGKQLTEARQLLNSAISREQRVTALYQDTVRERLRIAANLMRLKQLVRHG